MEEKEKIEIKFLYKKKSLMRFLTFIEARFMKSVPR